MDEIERAIGQTMRGNRKRQGITRESLAKSLGIPADLVAQIESGHRALELGEFFDWASALGIDSVDLFSQVSAAVLKLDA